MDQSQRRYMAMGGEFRIARRAVRLLWPSDLVEVLIYRLLGRVGERLDRIEVMMMTYYRRLGCRRGRRMILIFRMSLLRSESDDF